MEEIKQLIENYYLSKNVYELNSKKLNDALTNKPIQININQEGKVIVPTNHTCTNCNITFSCRSNLNRHRGRKTCKKNISV